MIEVVCLVLRRSDGKFLATRRGAGKRLAGLWEFPGGKIEPEEKAEAALRREIREELDLELGRLHPLDPVDHRYDFGTVRLFPFLAEEARGHLTLREHTEARWLEREALANLNWVPADIGIVETLEQNGFRME